MLALHSNCPKYKNYGRLSFSFCPSYCQLTREDNAALDKTFIFRYDNIGNITSIKTYAYTTDATPTGTYTEKTYTYDSTYKDRLTNFNGNSITYNSLGCPQYYDNKTWTWTKGKLTRIHRGSSSQPGSKYEDCTFTYDAYGRRTQKYYIYDPNPAVAGDGHYYYKTNYNYDESGRLIREFCTEYRDTGTTTTREFVYLYDESGIIGVMYSVNGAGAQPYFYRRNLQGDVIAIYDQTGSRKVEYAYDAFGNCTVKYTSMSDLANSNPIRYRGYYYDRETKLYYLNARYYNPEWRRFISPDDTSYLDPESVNGLNLYAYCYNDPVNYADPSGNFVISAATLSTIVWAAKSMVVGLVVGAAIGAGFEIGVQINENGWDPATWNLQSIGIAALGGGLSGLITACPVPNFTKLGLLGKLISYGFTFTLGAFGTLISGKVTGEIDFSNGSEVFLGVMVGGFSNVAARGISDLILDYQASKIMNQTRKAKSLEIQRLQGKLGVPGALKGGMRNSYKNFSKLQVANLLFEANPWIRFGIYSSINSAFISSLPYVFI